MPTGLDLTFSGLNPQGITARSRGFFYFDFDDFYAGPILGFDVLLQNRLDMVAGAAVRLGDKHFVTLYAGGLMRMDIEAPDMLGFGGAAGFSVGRVFFDWFRVVLPVTLKWTFLGDLRENRFTMEFFPMLGAQIEI